MTQRLTRHEDILMMSYFHHEKGDVTRWSSWEKRREIIRQDFPELLTLYVDMINTKKAFERVLSSIADEMELTEL